MTWAILRGPVFALKNMANEEQIQHENTNTLNSATAWHGNVQSSIGLIQDSQNSLSRFLSQQTAHKTGRTIYNHGQK